MDSTRAAVRDRDSRIAPVVGREAQLDLRFERQGSVTQLVHAYVEPPFCVRRAFDVGGTAYVIIVCSGPGIFGGDRLRQTIHVGRGARVALTSQSSVQIHPSACGSTAAVEQDFTVEREGELYCEWDPIIPFADSRVTQRTVLHLASSSHLWWSDAVMAGRVGRGERWRFRELAHELRFEIDRALVYLERYQLAPDPGSANALAERQSSAERKASAERRLDSRWIAGDATYLGTALARHPRATSDTAELMHGELHAIHGVDGAADLIDPHVILARCAARHGVAFASARRAYRRVVFEQLFESQVPWRKSV